MEEISQLRRYLEEHRYDDALQIAIDLEDMARDDKITRISSFAEVLLVHLIKQAAEQRTTRSWQVSMDYAAENIAIVNKRRKAGGFYLTPEELREAVVEAYSKALKRASLEAFEGNYTHQELGAMVHREALVDEALRLILSQHSLL
jgi:hypothetical protein